MKEQLQELRKKRGLTQKEMAEILGVKLTTYQKYELDIIAPSYETLIKIADFYGVTTDYLLGRNNDQPDVFALVQARFNATLLEKKLAEYYFKMKSDSREEVLQWLDKAVKEAMDEAGAIPEELRSRPYTETTLGEIEDSLAAENEESGEGA